MSNLDESHEKCPVVRVVVQIDLGSLEVLELRYGKIVLGHLWELELILIDLPNIHFQDWLRFALLFKGSPECLSLIPVLGIKALLEQKPLMVHLRDLIVSAPILGGLDQLEFVLCLLLFLTNRSDLLLLLLQLLFHFLFFSFVIGLDFFVVIGCVADLPTKRPSILFLLHELL